MAFHPYLNFGGSCREAFTVYQEVFGGELWMLPMSVMRQRISEHMVVSRRTSAHVTSFFEIDFTRVARIRAHGAVDLPLLQKYLGTGRSGLRDER